MITGPPIQTGTAIIPPGTIPTIMIMGISIQALIPTPTVQWSIIQVIIMTPIIIFTLEKSTGFV